METGTVKWFNDAKGWGLITTEDGREIFVSYSAIVSDSFKTLKSGEKVNFELDPKLKNSAKMVIKIEE